MRDSSCAYVIQRSLASRSPDFFPGGLADIVGRSVVVTDSDEQRRVMSELERSRGSGLSIYRRSDGALASRSLDFGVAAGQEGRRPYIGVAALPRPVAWVHNRRPCGC
jgi:hypothetical protein